MPVCHLGRRRESGFASQQSWASKKGGRCGWDPLAGAGKSGPCWIYKRQHLNLEMVGKRELINNK